MKGAIFKYLTFTCLIISFSSHAAQLSCRSDEVLITYQGDNKVYAVSTTTANTRRAVTPALGTGDLNSLAMDTNNGILYYVYGTAGDGNRAIRYYDFASDTQGVLVSDVNSIGISTTVGVAGGAGAFDIHTNTLYFGVESANGSQDIIYEIPITYTAGVPSVGTVSTFTSFSSDYEWGDIIVDSNYLYENYAIYDSSSRLYIYYLSVYSKATQALLASSELPEYNYTQIGIDYNGQLYRLSPSAIRPVTYNSGTNSFSYSGPAIGQNFGAITDGASCTPAPLLNKAFSETSILDESSTTLTFTLTNIGNNPAQPNISFVDTLPANLVVATTPNVGGTCPNTATAVTAAAGANSITVNNISMPSGTASCTITVDVTNSDEAINNDCTTNPVAFTNTKSNISGSDNVSTDSVTSACLEVTASSDVSVTKTDSSSTYTPGGSANYTITVQNAGPTGVSGVLVNDALPTGATLTGAWSCTVTTAGSGNVTTACPSATGGSAGDTAVNLSVNLANDGVITISVPIRYSSTP